MSEPGSYTLGNIAARLRMVVQYALTSQHSAVVVGTDHATEAVVGYYTKYGDGGTDFNVLSGLTKDTIYEIAELGNAPEAIMMKAPAAGLGISNSDEEELGMSYMGEIIPFLQGYNIARRHSASKERKIMQMYDKSKHKRHTPSVAQAGDYWSKAESNKEPIGHIIVDEVYAFIDMELACKNADSAVINTIEQINENPDQIVYYVQEYHPENHCSFKENGGTWPTHGVQGTRSCEIAKEFYSIKKSSNRPIEHYNIFRKGMTPDTEQYSGFGAINLEWGTLSDQLPKKVYVSGIATEYCVNETIRDLIEHGHEVYVKVENLAYVDEQGHKDTIQKWIDMGVHVEYHVKKYTGCKYFKFTKDYNFKHPVFGRTIAKGESMKVLTKDNTESICDGSITVFELNSDIAKKYGTTEMRPW
jgi:nicotinamidase-related amidase